MAITLIQGDILKAKTDYIVNAANSHLRHGGGIAKAIADAAEGAPLVDPSKDQPTEWRGGQPTWWRGKLTNVGQAWRKEQEDHPLVATGDATLTSAGCLPFKGIIHAVGPVWGGGIFYERELIQQAYSSAFVIAGLELSGGHLGDAEKVSVACPALSAGIFGMPVEISAYNGLSVADSMQRWNVDVEFVLFTKEHLDVFVSVAQTLKIAYSRV